MRTTTFFLVRHGDVENPSNKFYGRSVDVRLSSAGMEQTKKLGEYLKRQKFHPVAMYTSPMLRARQTASQISMAFKTVPTFVDERLNETKSSGLEKYTIDFLINLSDIYHSKLKGIKIEPARKLVKRINLFLDDIRTIHVGKHIIAVGHGDPIAYTLWSLLRRKPLPKWSVLREDLYLKRGEAASLVFSNSGEIVDHSFLRLGNLF